MSKDELVLLCRGKRGVEELSTARAQAKTGDDCHAVDLPASCVGGPPWLWWLETIFRASTSLSIYCSITICK